MALEIKKFNSPVLRKKTVKIESFNNKLKETVLEMKKTMIEKEGVGLAAPQVGISKKIIVFIDMEKQEVKELINPIVIQRGRKKDIKEEGCLSFPGIYLKIKRSLFIKVKGYDVNGNKVEIEAKEVLSRILQHEIDHLNGILFFDRLSFFKKIKFKIKNRGFNRYIN